MPRLFACYSIGRNAVEIKGGEQQCPGLRSGDKDLILIRFQASKNGPMANGTDLAP